MGAETRTVKARLQAGGRVNLPVGLASMAIIADILTDDGPPLRLAARADQGRFSVPRTYARALGAPIDVRLSVGEDPSVPSILAGAVGSVVLPLDGEVWFEAPLHSDRVELPSCLVRGLEAWTHVDAEVPGLAFPSRLRPVGADRRRMVMSVPSSVPRGGSCRFTIRRRDVIEDAPGRRPVRGGMFDWAAFVPDGAEAMNLGDGRIEQVRGRNRGLPIVRRTPLGRTLWMLGAWQAEGAKTAGFWGFDAALPGLASEMFGFLSDIWEIGDEDLKVVVRVPPGHDPDEARSRTERLLGRECVAIPNDTVAQPCIGLLPRRSSLVQEAMGQASAWMREGWRGLDREALWCFVDGYMCGDGAVTTLETTPARLGLSGPEEETRWVASMLDHVMGWPDGWRRSETWTISRALQPHHALALLGRGAFRHSMARARLLMPFERWFEAGGHAGPLDEIRRLRLAGVEDPRTMERCVPYPLDPVWTDSGPVISLPDQRRARWTLSRRIPYDCDAAAADAAKMACAESHYLGTWPSGWTVPVHDPKGGAVAVFSIPANPNLAKFLFGRRCRLVELSRLWSPDGSPHNYLSSFLGACLRGLRAADVADAVVSYADPRHGHSGTIYKATNWTYTGLSDPGMVWRLGDGTEVPRRHFHGSGGSLPDREIKAMGWERVRTPGKHRFVLVLDPRLDLRQAPPDRGSAETP